MTRPAAIELFSGCGGLSTGLLDAGIRVAGAFELDARAVEAFNYNHAYRGAECIQRDVSELTAKEILARTQVAKIDLLVGGPPCQPFSVVGKRRGEEDTRAKLVFEFARLVKEARPTAFIFENVPNFGSIANGSLLDSLMHRFERAGYACSAQILNAANFGVPQNRKRLVIIGVLGTYTPWFPHPTHGTIDAKSVNLQQLITSSAAIGDLPPAAQFGLCHVHNHVPTLHSPQMRDRFSRLLPGKRERGSFHDRLHPDRPSYTLRAGTGNFTPLRPVHYKYHRVITVRESARLQGFSDEFIWPDWIPRLQQYRQVGNAVPPPMARAIAEALAKQLGWKLTPHALEGDPTHRRPPITMSDKEKHRQQLRRIRGASLGKIAA